MEKDKNNLPVAIISAAILVAVIIMGIGYEKEKVVQLDSSNPPITVTPTTIIPPVVEKVIPNDQQAEIDVLKKEVESLKQRPFQTVIKEVPQEVRTETKTVIIESKDTTADIVKEWSPRVVYIECTWAYSNTGEVYKRASGSGTLINFRTDGIVATTNRHVLVNENGFGVSECSVVLPGVKSYSVARDNIKISYEKDWGILILTPDSVLNNVAGQDPKLCSTVDIGDKLLVLGYPGIGSKTGITITDGIVSADDGNYYITSAKIDHGSSGGAAILVKDNCYLGLPSSSAVGAIESLGRILKANFVIWN